MIKDLIWVLFFAIAPAYADSQSEAVPRHLSAISKAASMRDLEG